MEPRPTPLPPNPISSIESRMPSRRDPHSVPSQDASPYVSQSLSDHNSHLSNARRCGITAPQQLPKPHQTSTCPESIPTTTPPLALSSDDSSGCCGQSGRALRSPDGPIQVIGNLDSDSRPTNERRIRNANASVRFRQRRREKELRNAQRVAELEQTVFELTRLCNLYREDRNHFHKLAELGFESGFGSLRTPFPGVADDL